MIWLTTWVTIGGALVGSLLVASFVSELRRLRRAAVPHPAFVIRRRVTGNMLPHRRCGAVPLQGQTAWLAWDLRWLAAGQTLARVDQVNRESGELELRLRQPIELVAEMGAPAVRIEAVTFVPRRAQACYLHRSVRGKLLPSLPGGLTATAEVVVYPGV